MSHSADVCLYVLALHEGLLSEQELDARVQAAAAAQVSLKADLCAATEVDQTRLMRLLEERKQYARRCEDCRVTSYVLPGQAETCPRCQRPLFRPRHTPKLAGGRQLAKVAAERLSSGRVAQLEALPAEHPRRPRAPGGVTLAADQAPARPAGAPGRSAGRAATTTGRHARQAAPSPLEELQQQALVALKDLQRQGHLPRLAIAAGALLVVAFLWNMFAGMLQGIEWHVSDPASINEARARQCLRVVVINDPSRPDCLRFTKDVLLAPEVLEVAPRFVWQMDNAKGRIEPPNRSDDYAAAHLGTNQLPFVLIYDPNVKVVTGQLGAGDMTPAAFLALLEEAQQKVQQPAAPAE